MYEELVKRLRETSIDFGELDHVSVMLLEAADAIEKLNVFNLMWQEAAKIAHEAEPKWIPVTERLPDVFKHVLVNIPGMYPHPTVQEAFREKNGMWYSNGFRYEADEITHWMPLPKPPTEE